MSTTLERLPRVHARTSNLTRVLNAMRHGVAYQADDLCARAGLTRERTTSALSALALRGQVEVVEVLSPELGGRRYRRGA